MRLHKLKASESTGTYLVESPVTETDILLMARQLANLRLRRGRALTSPKAVFSHLQALLADCEHEVFALLLLDSRHRIIAYQEMFRGTLDGASVYPREVVKAALEHNAAAIVLVHNHPSGDPEPSQADLTDPQAEGGIEPGRGANAEPHCRGQRRLPIAGGTGLPVRRTRK